MDGVMVGDVELGEASATLSICGLVKPQLRPFLRELSHVYVTPEKRGQGEGTALLEAICEQADQEGLALLIQVDDTRLVPWYTRHGFDVLQETPILMVRPCQVTLN